MTETKVTPIHNEDGTCLYDGCEKLGQIRRITRRGWFAIDYCVEHERQAFGIFGAEQFEAVS